MDVKSSYQELIKYFFLAFKRLALYAVEHPLSRDILISLFKMFDSILKDQKEILVVAGAGINEIIVNEAPMAGDAMGVSELYDKFKILKLDGVSFVPGLAYEELSDFVKAMATASMRDAGKSPEVPPLLKDGSAHIKIKKMHYEKVEEGQKVVGAGDAGGGAAGPGVGQRGRVLRDVKNFLIGKGGEGETKADEVLEEFEHDVSGMTQAIIESAKESGDFEGVIRKLVSWMSKHVVPALVERKRDPSKFIMKIFDSFKKDEAVSIFPHVEETVAACADDVMIAMVREAHTTYKGSSKKGLALAAKILADEDDQKRVLPKIKARLVEHGENPEAADEFLKKLELELASDEEVTISKKKLHKLTRVAERFEEEVTDRVREATGELTRLNRRLADDKERTEGVMRHLADGLVVVDKAGHIVMMNPAAEKLLNTEMKESVGKSLAESITDEHLLAVAKGSLDDKGETRLTKEIELNSKNESTKKVLKASSAVVENVDGKAVGMVTVLSDITRQKEVDEMKGHFVSLVTHELRTPVVAIQKSLELILSKATGAITPEQEKFLSISRSNVERLNKLINDLLDMSQMESGKFVLRPSTFDFRDIMNEARGSLVSWADDKKIAIRLEVKDQPMSMTGDRNRLFQVLVNLLSNALKFTPSGGEIFVLGDASDSLVEVKVVDNGIGIDPKDFQRIFNKFEQVSLVAPQGVAGSGLGLPISKEIIGLHGGKIWVESEKGKGSRFIFQVPRTLKTEGV